jgi:hypothetical protein
MLYEVRRGKTTDTVRDDTAKLVQAEYNIVQKKAGKKTDDGKRSNLKK